MLLDRYVDNNYTKNAWIMDIIKLNRGKTHNKFSTDS
jgi:hypothetical protein